MTKGSKLSGHNARKGHVFIEEALPSVVNKCQLPTTAIIMSANIYPSYRGMNASFEGRRWMFGLPSECILKLRDGRWFPSVIGASRAFIIEDRHMPCSLSM